jgi:hypothetical protein
MIKHLRGFVGLALLMAAVSAQAQCGGLGKLGSTHTAWHPQLGQARLLRASFVTVSDPEFSHEEAPIVGFWHVKFTSEGSKGIPDGAEVDAGYAQWHSDGTEIMNSGGRAPDTGDFCLGVWQKVGECEYKLNHFAAAWDPVAGKLIGPANIREDVKLTNDGTQFAGVFTIDQYDEAGNLLAHVQGKITGVRIEADTPPTSIF